MYRLWSKPESLQEKIYEYVGYREVHLPNTLLTGVGVDHYQKSKGCIYCHDRSPRKIWENRFAAIMVRYEQSGLTHRKRSEIVNRLKKISKSASEISGAIKNTPFDTSPYNWIDKNEWIIDASGCLTRGLTLNDSICDNCRKLRDQDGPQNTWGSPALGSMGVIMSTIMERIADEAKEQLKLYQGETKEQPDLYILKPRADNARANYFIRAMSVYFEKVFGKPCYELLADLATVVLEPHLDEGKTISESDVASSLKEFRKTRRKNK